MSETEKIEIKNRWTGATVFTCEVAVSLSIGGNLGAAVKLAIAKGADLRSAYLSGANLSGADLSGAVLSGADLSGADLRSADLSGADLSGADLSGADLRSADLSGADLSGADLSGAVLRSAVLSGANLSGSKDIPRLAAAQASIVPEEGDYIGWKRCEGNVIAKLMIPAAARRSNASGRKCRAEFADVLEVIGAPIGVSMHDRRVTYEVGKRVIAHAWEEDRWQECAGGIHHFITRIEAENYV